MKLFPKEPWWKQTYIWIVFFRRSRYRPIASTFPWLIFILPAMLMVFIYSMGLFGIAINGKAKKLEEMKHMLGIITRCTG